MQSSFRKGKGPPFRGPRIIRKSFGSSHNDLRMTSKGHQLQRAHWHCCSNSRRTNGTQFSETSQKIGHCNHFRGIQLAKPVPIVLEVWEGRCPSTPLANC
eukprot:5412376-Karenia_brevis.AAC.1